MCEPVLFSELEQRHDVTSGSGKARPEGPTQRAGYPWDTGRGKTMYA